MAMINVSAALALLLGTAAAPPTKFINSVAGPFAVEFVEAGSCDPTQMDPRHAVATILSVGRHYNGSIRSYLVDASAILNETLQRGKYEVQLDAAKWDPVSGWRPHFFISKLGDPCAFMDLYQERLKSLVQVVQPTPPTRCPIPKNVYSVHNERITNDDAVKNIPVFPYGRYKAHGFAIDVKTKAIAACAYCIFQIKPKVGLGIERAPSWY